MGKRFSEFLPTLQPLLLGRYAVLPAIQQSNFSRVNFQKALMYFLINKTGDFFSIKSQKYIK